MTNALALLTGTELAEADELDALIAQEMAEEGGQAFDFKPASIKIGSGGINQFITGSGDAYKELNAIVVVSQKASAYWPKSDDGGNYPPLCQSPDAIVGAFNAQVSDVQFDAAINVPTPHPGVIMMSENKGLPDAFNCNGCPLAQWGSMGGGSNAQACKSLNKLLLLIDGWAAPAILTLPPTSLNPYNDWASGLQSVGKAYFIVRAKLTLETKGTGSQKYSVLKIEKVSDLSKDESKAVIEIRNQFKAHVKSRAIQTDDYIDTSAVTGTTADDEVAPF